MPQFRSNSDPEQTAFDIQPYIAGMIKETYGTNAPERVVAILASGADNFSFLLSETIDRFLRSPLLPQQGTASINEGLGKYAFAVGRAAVIEEARDEIEQLESMLKMSEASVTDLDDFRAELVSRAERAKERVSFAAVTVRSGSHETSRYMSDAAAFNRQLSIAEGVLDFEEDFARRSSALKALASHPALAESHRFWQIFESTSQQWSVLPRNEFARRSEAHESGDVADGTYAINRVEQWDREVSTCLEAVRVLGLALNRYLGDCTSWRSLPLGVVGALRTALVHAGDGLTFASVKDIAKTQAFVVDVLGFREPSAETILGIEPPQTSRRYQKFRHLYRTGFSLGLSESVLSENSQRFAPSRTALRTSQTKPGLELD